MFLRFPLVVCTLSSIFVWGHPRVVALLAIYISFVSCQLTFVVPLYLVGCVLCSPIAPVVFCNRVYSRRVLDVDRFTWSLAPCVIHLVWSFALRSTRWIQTFAIFPYLILVRNRCPPIRFIARWSE